MDNIVDIRPRTIKIGNMEDGTIKEVTLKPGETATEAMDRLAPVKNPGTRRSARMSSDEFPDECAYPIEGEIYNPDIRRGLDNWMNFIHGANASMSAAARRILRPAMLIMREMTEEGYEVCDAAYKHPKKKKVVDQAKEGRLRKKQLADKFMARQREKREEKSTREDAAEHVKNVFDSLDRRQHVLLVSTPSGNGAAQMRMLQQLHDTDSVGLSIGAPLWPTIFETEMQLSGSAIPHNVIDLQAEMRKVSSRTESSVLPQDVHSVKYFPFCPKEKDDEQGTDPPHSDR